MTENIYKPEGRDLKDLHLVRWKQWEEVGQLLVKADQGRLQPHQLVVMGPPQELQLAQGYPVILHILSNCNAVSRENVEISNCNILEVGRNC